MTARLARTLGHMMTSALRCLHRGNAVGRARWGQACTKGNPGFPTVRDPAAMALHKTEPGYVLCVTPPGAIGPDWDRLFETAAGQSGYVTTKQAAAAGYSTHLLRKHIHVGRVTRPQRGIYRLVHFPVGEHEELVTAWLWSEQASVVSHQTALSLHGLSDRDFGPLRGTPHSASACLIA